MTIIFDLMALLQDNLPMLLLACATVGAAVYFPTTE